MLDSGSVFGLVAPALSLPIFDGGKLRANLAGSDAQYDLAVADYNQKVISALREVADQVTAVRSLQQRAQAQNDAVQTAMAASIWPSSATAPASAAIWKCFACRSRCSSHANAWLGCSLNNFWPR